MLPACFVNSHSLGSNKVVLPGDGCEASARAAMLKMSLVLHKMVQCSISFSNTLLFVFDRVVIGRAFIFIDQVTLNYCRTGSGDTSRA